MSATNLNPYASPLHAGGPPAGSGDACVRIRRASGFVDSLRAYRIEIDGAEAAQIRDGQTVEIPVESGSHRMAVRVDWCGSPTVEFNVSSGATVEFECGSNLHGGRILLGFVYVFFRRNSYLTLQPVANTPAGT